jgi:leucine-zipper-like transcriptional regulator 1
MYVFGGYDGVYKNDFHKFNFITNTWTLINGNLSSPNYPTPRYRTAATVYKDRLFLFGGHDGVKQLNDFYCHNFSTEEWTSLNFQSGVIPSPRDSHIFVSYQNSIYLFGGSTGKAVNDFYEYKIEEGRWTIVNQCGGISPTPRFCHSAVIIGNGLFIFGGYDGHSRLKDFKIFQFESECVKIQPSSLNKDLLDFVNSKLYSDIDITVEGSRLLHAHRIFLRRSPYFKAMFDAEMKETVLKQVNIENVSYDIMLQVLRYLYTDDCEINLSVYD